jgi:hypothetical protein
MNSDKIPGVPEGWEVVHVDRFGKPGEYCVGPLGEPHLIGLRTIFRVCIIRKIEKPAAYRQFANAAEAHPFWNVALRYRSSLVENKDSRFRINTIGYDGITIGLEYYSYKAAFDGFCIDDDGTPFGVKIEESKENE